MFLFCNLNPFLCKTVFRWKHYKSSVFSRAQLLWITDSKKPFRDPFQKHPFSKKGDFWFSPVPAEKDNFPKADNVDEHALFFAFQTQIVFATFLNKPFLTKSTSFPPTPKALFVCSLALFLFVFFLSVCLSPTWTNAQTSIFLYKNLFTSRQFGKTVFWHPYSLSVILNIPKNIPKLGKTSKHSWTRYWRNTWSRYWFKNPQILDQMLTLQHIYIYIYVPWRLSGWPSLAFQGLSGRPSRGY